MEEFYEILLPHASRLYRFAYRLTHNERDAEDLVQDTLLRAYQKFDQFQPGTNPMAWLLVILRSIFINKYRKRKREGVHLNLDELGQSERAPKVEVSWGPNTPEDFLMHHLLDIELRDALEKLPQHYLEVILLVDMEEMSYREAAEVLDIPPGTIMSRLHRARKTLQAQLQDLAIRKGIVKDRKIQPIYPKGTLDKRGGTDYGS